MKQIKIGCWIGVLVLSATAACAQMPAYNQAGPVPAAIAAAKTIFLSNGGADSGLFLDTFTGDPDRAYTEFYAALKATGDFTLVGDPSQADLVVELGLEPPYGPAEAGRQPFTWPGEPLPMFRLVIYDRKSHYVLWTCTQSVQSALSQKNHDKNFDQALAAILNQFLQIAGKSPVQAGQTPGVH